MSDVMTTNQANMRLEAENKLVTPLRIKQSERSTHRSRSRQRHAPLPTRGRKSSSLNAKYGGTEPYYDKKRRSRSLAPSRTKLPRYSKGYHALLAMVKDLKDMKEKKLSEPRYEMPSESAKLAARVEAKRKREKQRRSRSYSRGRGIYFEENGEQIPYYRSRSVEQGKRNSTTYRPVTNEDDIINITYTGRASRPTSRESSYSRSSRRRRNSLVQKKVESVRPSDRTSYDFGDLQARIYQEIQNTYGAPDSDAKHKQFFLTLAVMQKEHNNLKRLKLSSSDKALLQKSFDEMKTLKKETNSILVESKKRTSPQSRPLSINSKLQSLMKKTPKEDYYLRRERSKERLRLKPLRNQNSVLKNDFYDRQRLKGDWRYNVHLEQRQRQTTESQRFPVRQVTKDFGKSPISSAFANTESGGSAYKHRNLHKPHQSQGVPVQYRYRDAKESLLYSHRSRPPPLVNDLSHKRSEGVISYDVAYRHRMHGFAK
ncbi:uncharacterized protein LOC128210611 [Mya arenaria]|uniref:uncharacterized protein LOC128210611 n=1 Tax=Mya arenaria TaxID=6604 RepID=UPI0022E6A35B|nr:uncharacterized protein LOC128210611 [Mya arenaria]